MREKWKEAYRLARIIVKSNPENEAALASLPRLFYRAWLVAKYKRHEVDWRMTMTPRDRLESKKIINEIIDELIKEGK